MNDEIAWLKDVGDADDPCYVPAAKGDPGAFPVYGEPRHEALVEALRKWDAYDALLRTISGTMLLSGDMPSVDAIYDDCVAATKAALETPANPIEEVVDADPR